MWMLSEPGGEGNFLMSILSAKPLEPLVLELVFILSDAKQL